LLLPYVLDALRADADVAERVATLGAAMEGIPDGEATAGRTVARIADLNRAIGVPATLAEIGVEREQLPRIADLALRSTRLIAIAPVEPSRELLVDILERALHGVLTDRSAA
jgi:alcohol dehydrogenase